MRACIMRDQVRFTRGYLRARETSNDLFGRNLKRPAYLRAKVSIRSREFAKRGRCIEPRGFAPRRLLAIYVIHAGRSCARERAPAFVQKR